MAEQTITILAILRDLVSPQARTIGQSLDYFSERLGKLDSAISPVQGRLSAFLASFATFQGIRYALQEARDATQSLAALRVALGDNQDKLNQELEKTQQTVDKLNNSIGGDSINRAKATLLDLGVSYDQLDDAIGATIEVNAKLGGQLDDTAKDVARLLTSSPRNPLLRRVLQDVSEDALRTGEAFRILNERLAGGAAEKGGTEEGRLAAAQERFNDALETAGKAIMPYYLRILDALGRAMVRLSEASEKPWVKNLLNDLARAAEFILNNVENIIMFFAIMKGMELVISLWTRWQAVLGVVASLMKILFNLHSGSLLAFVLDFGLLWLAVATAVGLVGAKMQGVDVSTRGLKTLFTDIGKLWTEGFLTIDDLILGLMGTIERWWSTIKYYFNLGINGFKYGFVQVFQLLEYYLTKAELAVVKFIQDATEKGARALNYLPGVNIDVDNAPRDAQRNAEERLRAIEENMGKSSDEGHKADRANQEAHDKEMKRIQDREEARNKARNDAANKDREVGAKAREEEEAKLKEFGASRLQRETNLTKQVELIRANSIKSLMELLSMRPTDEEYKKLLTARVEAEKSANEIAYRNREVTALEYVRKIGELEIGQVENQYEEVTKRLADLRAKAEQQKGDTKERSGILNQIRVAEVEAQTAGNRLFQLRVQQQIRLRDALLNVVTSSVSEEEKIELESNERRYQAGLITYERYLAEKERLETWGLNRAIEQTRLAQEEVNRVLEEEGKKVFEGKKANVERVTTAFQTQGVLARVMNTLLAKSADLTEKQRIEREKISREMGWQQRALENEIDLRLAQVTNSPVAVLEAEAAQRRLDFEKQLVDLKAKGADDTKLGTLRMIFDLEEEKRRRTELLEIEQRRKLVQGDLASRIAAAREDVAGQLRAERLKREIEYEQELVRLRLQGESQETLNAYREMQRFEMSRRSREDLIRIIDEASDKLRQQRQETAALYESQSITLDEASRRNSQSLDEFRKKIKDVGEEFNQLITDGVFSEEDVRKIQDRLRMAIAEFEVTIESLARKINEGFFSGLDIRQIRQRLREMLDEVDEVKVEMVGRFIQLREALQGPIEGLISDFMSGTKSMQEIWYNFVRAIADNFIKIFSQELTDIFLRFVTRYVLQSILGEQQATAATATGSATRSLFRQQEATQATVAAGTVIASEQAKGAAAQASAAQEIPATAAKAGAKAADSQAGIPIIGPILAIAAIAAVVGAIMALARNKGGKVAGDAYGEDKDSVLVNLTSGEYVHNRRAVNYYGESFMKAINEQRIPREILPRNDGGGVGYFDRMRSRANVAYNVVPPDVAMASMSSSLGASDRFVDARNASNDRTSQNDAQTPVAIVAPTEENFSRLLNGGSRAMIRWLGDHRSEIKRITG